MRSWFTWGVGFFVVVVLGVFGYDIARQAQLNWSHVLTEGRVVAVEPHLMARQIEVVYPVGSRQEAESTVGIPWPLAVPALNSVVPVEYSPDDPTRASLPGWLDFSVYWAWVWAAMLPLLAVALLLARSAGYTVGAFTGALLHLYVAGGPARTAQARARAAETGAKADDDAGDDAGDRDGGSGGGPARRRPKDLGEQGKPLDRRGGPGDGDGGAGGLGLSA